MDRLAKAIDVVDQHLTSATNRERDGWSTDEVADLLLDVRCAMRMIHDVDDLELRLYAVRGD